MQYNVRGLTNLVLQDIACNTNASPAKGVCTVAAGSQVSPEMHQQPGDRTCANEAIGGNHDGPTIVYLYIFSLLNFEPLS